MITVAPAKLPVQQLPVPTTSRTFPVDASAVIETDVPTGKAELVVSVTEPERVTALPDTEPVSVKTMEGRTPAKKAWAMVKVPVPDNDELELP